MLNLFNYIGNIAFVIVGIVAAKRLGLRGFWQFWSGIATFCFGGLFRDLVLLDTVPAILGSPFEIAKTAIVGIITIAALRNVRSYKKVPLAILCTGDSVGIAAFVVVGFGRGMQAGAPWWLCLICGFVTAFGGGIFAAVIRTASARKFSHLIGTLAGNKIYYLYGAAMALGCFAMHTFGGNSDSELLAFTVAAIILGLLVENQKSKK